MFLAALGLLCLSRLSSCGEQRLLSSCVRASHCSSFSHCRAKALEGMSFSCCSAQALEHRLSCSMTCGIFLDQGLNPALAGRFFTIESPEKPSSIFFWTFYFVLSYRRLQCCDSFRWTVKPALFFLLKENSHSIIVTTVTNCNYNYNYS